MLTKAIGDIFPTIDPNRSLFINLSYEKLISEANMLNYDYIADSFSLSFFKVFQTKLKNLLTIFQFLAYKRLFLALILSF